MTYLITGATGSIGSLVVERLIGRGDRLRVFVRDVEKARSRFGDRVDIFAGDLANARTLTTAANGADAILLLNSGPDLAARDAAAAKVVRDSSVNLIVKLSSFDATQQNVGTGVWHAHGESTIRDIGIPFTFVQPSGFVTNSLFWAKSMKAEGIVRTATGEGKIPFVHPLDIADVATKALTTREYVGESLPITGPEALSYREMTTKIGIAIGKALRVQAISDEEERRRMTGWDDAEVVAHLSIYRAIREGRLAAVTDTVERVLGRKPIAFEQWAKENAAAFC